MTKTIRDSQEGPTSKAELVYKAKQAEQKTRDTDPHQHPDSPEVQQDVDIRRKSYSTSRDAFPYRKLKEVIWSLKGKFLKALFVSLHLQRTAHLR